MLFKKTRWNDGEKAKKNIYRVWSETFLQNTFCKKKKQSLAEVVLLIRRSKEGIH